MRHSTCRADLITTVSRNTQMKITGYEVIPIKGRAMILKVHTDAEITGLGEPLDYGHGDVVAKAIEVLFGIARPIESPRYLEDAAARIAAMREAVGPDVDIAVDFHRRLTPAMAIRMLKELEPYKIMFAEEPCHPENDDALLMIARSTTTPIATGERHTTRWGFREIIEKQAAAVLQP